MEGPWIGLVIMTASVAGLVWWIIREWRRGNDVPAVKKN